jgi:hypothetical protein
LRESVPPLLLVRLSPAHGEMLEEWLYLLHVMGRVCTHARHSARVSLSSELPDMALSDACGHPPFVHGGLDMLTSIQAPSNPTGRWKSVKQLFKGQL